MTIPDLLKPAEKGPKARALASLKPIFSFDFTKSNKWKGTRSFNGRSLHHIEGGPNPYEQAISIIGKTLTASDEDKLIPCLGFGDATTRDQDVFSFYPGGKICKGFKQVLSRYREIVPHLRLAGPTSFAPVIEMTMDIVQQRGGKYHILVIFTDSQVPRMDAEYGELSPQEQKTKDVIVEASKFPLSIIFVGVGDGPWDTMKKFEDKISDLNFDNFLFVNFSDNMKKDSAQKERAFARALEKVRSRYKAIVGLNLPCPKANDPPREPLPPPPMYDSSPSNGGPSIPMDITRLVTSSTRNNLVIQALLAHDCIEACNLIIGIDFTKSNEWTGARSFNRQSLHHIGDGLNPYQQAISTIGRIFHAFDENDLVPFFGFGDETTRGKDVFKFFSYKEDCNGFKEALSQYRTAVPHLRLAGPTSFAPIIEVAMTIVKQSNSNYHVLVVITDGQVTRVETECDKLSPWEQETADAIVKARKFPLSIIFVGVGDGPWDAMNKFDTIIPDRDFNNFHFVNFTEIMSHNIPLSEKEEKFAHSLLKKILSQYKAVIELNLMGKAIGPLRTPPPTCGSEFFGNSEHSQTTNVGPFIRLPPDSEDCNAVCTPPPATSSTDNSKHCPVCLEKTEDNMAFRCGHQTCYHCAPHLESCPLCRGPIDTRIMLQDNENSVDCPVCEENTKDMAFECGHQTCHHCGPRLESCPSCGSPVDTGLRLFTP